MSVVANYAVAGIENSRRIPSEPQLIIFRKRPLKRVAASLGSLFFFTLPFEIVKQIGSSDATSNEILLLVMCIVCWSLSAVELWLTQPEELRLDLQKQTYLCTHGWSLWSKQWWGEFSDFAGIDVDSRGSKSSRFYLTRLLWITPRKKTFSLGTFGKKEKANQLAEEIRTELWRQAASTHIT